MARSAIRFTSHAHRRISSLSALAPSSSVLPIEGMTRNDILQASATVWIWIWLIIDKISTTQQGGRNEDKDVVEGFKIRIPHRFYPTTLEAATIISEAGLALNVF
jgi:hypothetical protein